MFGCWQDFSRKAGLVGLISFIVIMLL